MNISRRHFAKTIAVAAAMVLTTALPSLAQTYPSRPVQLVVGYAQGGTGDFIARLMAEKLTTTLGQPVNVENRPGASGTAAAQSVARAARDGYTLLVGQPGEVSINPMLTKDLGYDPARDLQPVALAALSPLALVVQSTAPSPPIIFPGGPERWWGDEALKAETDTPQATLEQRHQAAGDVLALRCRGFFSAGGLFLRASHSPVETAP